MAVKMYSLATFGMPSPTINVHEQSTLILINCLFTVMVYYDIILTFGDEVERVWMKKFTWFTVLWFLVCGYLYRPHGLTSYKPY